MKERIHRLRSLMEDSGLACSLVTGRENVRYLSGFSGSNGVGVVSFEKTALVTDGRYAEQVRAESPGWDAVIYKEGFARSIVGVLPDAGKIGIEPDVTCRFFREIEKHLSGDARLVVSEDLVESLRAVKDPAEVESIRRAIACAASAFEAVLPMFSEGESERLLAAELDYRMMLAGADRPAFDTIVASGPNSSRPHAPVSDRAIENGDLVVVDFGASRRGYKSDSTRTLLVSGDGERLELLGAVRGALQAALESLEPGMKASRADRAARSHLEGLGLADHFFHGLGHGVGLAAHEKPTLSSRSEDVLEPGMVFTVEPGVYLEGIGGVRIEEMILMTEDGHEILTGSIP